MAIIAIAIVEFLMFGVGVWALYYDVLPERWFDMVFGQGDYRTSPQTARLFGLVLVIPFLFFVSRFLFNFRLLSIWLDEYLHVGVLGLMLVITFFWARQIKNSNKTKKKIRSQQDVGASLEDIDDWQ